MTGVADRDGNGGGRMVPPAPSIAERIARSLAGMSAIPSLNRDRVLDRAIVDNAIHRALDEREAPPKRAQGSWAYEAVRVGDIVVPEEYQAHVQTVRVHRMAASWDDRAIGTPELNRRPTGVLVAVDGMHRIGALGLQGRSDETVRCKVHHHLTLEEEADLYLVLANRKNKTRNNLMHARVMAGDELAVAAKQLVEERGFTIPRKDNQGASWQPGMVSATQTLEKEIERFGVDHAGTVLDVVGAVWGEVRGGFNRDILLGVSQFLRAYPSHPRPKLVARLRSLKIEPAEFERRSRSIRISEGSGFAKGYNAGRTVLAFLNRGSSSPIDDRFNDMARADKKADRERRAADRAEAAE